MAAPDNHRLIARPSFEALPRSAVPGFAEDSARLDFHVRFTSRADIYASQIDVCFVPIADIRHPHYTAIKLGPADDTLINYRG